MLKRCFLSLVLVAVATSAFAAPRPIQVAKEAVKKVVDVVRPNK
jgi:hypothetical protein